MEIVQFYNCKNIYEAKIKEQEHFTELKASLNSIEPMKPKEKVIDVAKIQHQVSEEHEVSKFNYNCKKCNYICNSQSLWRQHLDTKKHNKDEIESIKNTCTCGTSYKTRSGLWKHVKSCQPKPELPPQQPITEITTLTNLIMEFVTPFYISNADFNDIKNKKA